MPGIIIKHNPTSKIIIKHNPSSRVVIGAGADTPSEALRKAKEYTDMKVSQIHSFEQRKVDVLPTTGEPYILYFVPASDPQTGNVYDEYIWVLEYDSTPAHWEKVGSTAYIPDHTIEDKPTLNKLLVTLNPGQQEEAKFLVSRDPYTVPANPTFSPASGGSADGSLTVNMSTETEGAVIYYSLDLGSTWTEGSSVTLEQDTSSPSATYTLYAKAVKNGLTSGQASASYTVYRKVAKPTIGLPTKDKYELGRVVSFSCSTSGATILYKINDGSWLELEGSSITFSQAGTFTIVAKAEKGGWQDSDEQTKFSNNTTAQVVVGANKCYIGQRATAPTTVAEIQAMTNVQSYKRDTLVGYTTPVIDFGSTPQYVWFCIPKTDELNLAIKGNTFDLPLNSDAGTLVPSSDSVYRVWRSEATLKETYSFEIKQKTT